MPRGGFDALQAGRASPGVGFDGQKLVAGGKTGGGPVKMSARRAEGRF